MQRKISTPPIIYGYSIDRYVVNYRKYTKKITKNIETSACVFYYSHRQEG